MADEVGRFTVYLEHLQGFEYKVKFDWPQCGPLIMDEPAPLGEQKGPNAARLLAAAIGNCLSASLLFCIAKHEPPDAVVRTEVACRMVRDEKRRMRVGAMQVRIEVGGALEESARLSRCLGLFEEFCVVTQSVRKGIAVGVQLVNESGKVLAQG